MTDPVFGCATAENLGRRWIGIDISPKAFEPVNMRLQQSMGGPFHNRLVTARTDIPKHTDIDAPVPYRQNKHVLFGQQGGRCNGWRSEFPFRALEVDTSSLSGPVAKTTSRTCNCCAPTATG